MGDARAVINLSLHSCSQRWPILVLPCDDLEYRLRGIYEMLLFRYPRKNMETEKISPLHCSECNGVLLPENAVRLQNEMCMLRYFCIGCGRRSYAVKVGPAVRIYPSSKMETVMDSSELET